MKECDKGSAEPAVHLGPFEFVEAQEEFTIERCHGCGNVVLRRGTGGSKEAERAPGATVVRPRGPGGSV